MRNAAAVLLLGLTTSCSFACSTGAPVQSPEPGARIEERNKDIVRRFYVLLNEGDYDALDSLVAPDYRHQFVVDTGFAVISWSAFREGNMGVRRAFPDWHLTPVLLIAEGDMVAALVTGTGTHRGRFAGIDPTHQMVRLPLVLIHEVRDGRLVSDHEVVNSAPLLRRLTGE